MATPPSISSTKGTPSAFLDHGGHTVHGDITETRSKLLEEPISDGRL